jgi:hypothetical protein
MSGKMEKGRVSGRLGLFVVGLLVGAGAFGIASAIYASIPGPGEVINGCYKKNGDLRVLDSSAACKNDETALNWNRTGPTGPTGADGSPGGQGQTGPSDSWDTGRSILIHLDTSSTTVRSLSLPAGLYFVVAKTVAYMPQNQVNGSISTVDCELAGGSGSDFSEALAYDNDQVSLPAVGTFGGLVASTMSLQMQTDMGAGGTVTLKCSSPDSAGPVAASVYSARINAIKVGALH